MSSSPETSAAEAFFDRIEPHLSAVEAYVAHRSPEPAQAEDLVQEVLYRALSGRGRLAPGADLRPWLMGIARNCLGKAWRRRGRGKRVRRAMLARAIIEERERILGTADDPDRLAEMVVALRGCLDEAPENARALLKMRHVEDRTPAEIARQVGCSPESVRALMFRLKDSLRRCIERKTGGASLA